MGARKRWALSSPEARRRQTEKARATFFQKFLDQVDAAVPGLPEHERVKRAETLRSAYYQDLRKKRLGAELANEDLAPYVARVRKAVPGLTPDEYLKRARVLRQIEQAERGAA